MICKLVSTGKICALLLLFTASLQNDTVNADIAESNITENEDRLLKEPRIIGGDDAPKGRYSYVVSLIDDWGQHVCGGTLVSKNYVLTSAHCEGLIHYVRLGLHDLLDVTAETLEQMSIVRAVIHPNYCSETNEYDFMMLKLSSSSQFEPVVLDQGEEEFTTGQEVTTVGWGITDGGTPSRILREVQLDVRSNDECQQDFWMRATITPDMICASRDGKDACRGDSGGPLIIEGTDSKSDVQIAVTSWGIGCAEKRFPGVYSRVSKVKFWIKEIINEERINIIADESMKDRSAVRENFRAHIRHFLSYRVPSVIEKLAKRWNSPERRLRGEKSLDN